MKKMSRFRKFRTLPAAIATVTALALGSAAGARAADDRLVFKGKDGPGKGKHIVLISGDEEYRTEESMPMLGKILSQHHGFDCTVLFALDPSGSYIDSNNGAGLRGLESLGTADLMIIGTRFRTPSEEEAKHITDFLNAGKPVIGIRTATHAFNGKGSFGGIGYGEFGRKVLGEQWINHHGRHKVEGARGVIEEANAKHPILNSVKDIFAPSDVYGVVNLTEKDTILMRAAVTETLDPASKAVEGGKNDPMMPFAWLHTYTTPDGKGEGTSFCTTGGASVDLVSDDLRRIIVNAACHLVGLDVPEKAYVSYVDPFYPSFYGFTKGDWWKDADLQPSDFDLGKSPVQQDPPGSPAWPHRPTKPE